MMKTRMRMAMIAATTLIGTAALEAEIVIPAPRVFPESITASKTGDLYVGSAGDGSVWRARPGQPQATLFLDPAKTGMHGMLGVYADDRGGKLWACQRPGAAEAPEARDRASAVRTFDLKTGASIATYPMPNGAKDVCNDFAIARDGTVYIAETATGIVYRIARGASAIDMWLADDRLKGADGIAMDGDDALLVASVITGRAFRIAIGKDTHAAATIELTPSRPLAHPDGVRALGGHRFLVTENGADGGVAIGTLAGNRLDIRKLDGGQGGTTSAVAVGGTGWAVVAKLGYLRDPALRDKDPGVFSIYSFPLK